MLEQKKKIKIRVKKKKKKNPPVHNKSGISYDFYQENNAFES